MKMIGERWSKLDVDLKKQYGKLAAEEKIRYNQEMAVYRKETTITNLIMPTENQPSVVEQRHSTQILA
jgi:hypothetical protein